MGFARPGYWSGLPFPSPGDLPNPGIEPGSLIVQADTLLSELPGKPKCVATEKNDKNNNYSISNDYHWVIKLLCSVLAYLYFLNFYNTLNMYYLCSSFFKLKTIKF